MLRALSADFQYTIVGEAKQKRADGSGETLFTVTCLIYPAVIFNIVGSGSRKIRTFPDTTKSKRWMEKFDAELSNLKLTVTYNWHMRCVF
jgi:hypothetical protein